VHGSSNIYGGNGNNNLLNQGAIQSDVLGQTLSINNIRLDLINNGTMSAINGARLDLSNGNNNIINNGTMNAASGSEIDVGSNGGSFTNNGTIGTNAATLALYGNWHNAGTMNVTNTALYLGGSFAQSDLGNFIHSGGSINLIGTINNGLSLTSSTGPWNLSGGTISGGSLTITGAGSLQVNNGNFDNVALNSDLTIPSNASLNVFNGITLNAKLSLAGASMYLYGDSPIIAGPSHEMLL